MVEACCLGFLQTGSHLLENHVCYLSRGFSSECQALTIVDCGYLFVEFRKNFIRCYFFYIWSVLPVLGWGFNDLKRQGFKRSKIDGSILLTDEFWSIPLNGSSWSPQSFVWSCDNFRMFRLIVFGSCWHDGGNWEDLAFFNAINSDRWYLVKLVLDENCITAGSISFKFENLGDGPIKGKTI